MVACACDIASPHSSFYELASYISSLRVARMVRGCARHSSIDPFSSYELTQVTMALPGTKFIMDGMNGGHLVGDGRCCFSAVGNSMQNAGVDLAELRRDVRGANRGLSKIVKDLIEDEIKTCAETRDELEHTKAVWDQKGSLTVANYVEKTFIRLRPRVPGERLLTCRFWLMCFAKRILRTDSLLIIREATNTIILPG